MQLYAYKKVIYPQNLVEINSLQEQKMSTNLISACGAAFGD
jgi:hypothetical protein